LVRPSGESSDDEEKKSRGASARGESEKFQGKEKEEK